MNFLLAVLVSAVLVVGIINTEPKDNEGNKETQVIVKESSETKPAQEEVKEEVKPEAQAAAEAEAAAEAQAEAQAAAEAQAEAQAAAADSGINYLRLALYIFGLILVISIGTYFYLRQRDNSSSRSAARAPDSPRRDFRKEVKFEPQEEQLAVEEVKSEPQEEQPVVEEVKSEPQEKQPAEDENKDLKTEEESNEDEKK